MAGAQSPDDEETASSPTADEEDPTTIGGRGGWLVDLVEGIELWALPSTAEQQQLLFFFWGAGGAFVISKRIERTLPSFWRLSSGIALYWKVFL